MLTQWIYVAQLFTALWLAVATAQNGLPTDDLGDYGLCDPVLGQHPPLSTGKCAEGTAWMDKHECCVECVYCAAGSRKLKAGCHEDCVECVKGTYSSASYNQEDSCLPCTGCAFLHRQILRVCDMKTDTKCGNCLHGYYEDSQAASGSLTSCSVCTYSSQHENCVGYTSPGAHTGPEHGKNDQSTGSSSTPIIVGAVAGLLVLIIIVIVVVFLVVRRRRRKQNMDNIVEAEEQHPLQTPDIDTPDIIRANAPDNGKSKTESKERDKKPDLYSKESPKIKVRSSETQVVENECPTVEIVTPRDQPTPNRRVKFEGDPLRVTKNKRNGYEKTQSSDEEEYKVGDHSPEDFKTAIGYPLGHGLGDKEAKSSSFQSIDDDESAAAAWGYFTGVGKNESDTDEKHPPKTSLEKRRLQEPGTQEFSSLPQSY